jgi:acyl carrier protein
MDSRVKRHNLIKDDEDLLAAGHLDSMGVLQLIAFVESLSGTPIDLSSLKMENFSTIGIICERYLNHT